MKTKICLFSWIFVLLLSACSDNEGNTLAGNFPDDGKVRISTVLEAQQTKADPVVYTGSNLSLSIDYGTGSPFTVTNMKWTSAENGTLWTPESQMLWKDATTAAKVYSYAPYVNAVTDVEAVPFTVNADQRSGLTSSDLLVYKDEAFIPGSSLSSKQALDITFSHTLSKVIVHLVYGDQWGDVPPAVTNVAINGTMPTTSLNMRTGALATASGDMATISTRKSELNVYEAIVVPQTVASDTRLVSIELENGEVYAYSITASAGLVFESGKQHVITLRVGKDKVELGSVEVADWGAAVDLGNGDSEIEPFTDPAFTQALISDYNIPHTNGVIDPIDPATKAAIEGITILELSDKGIKNIHGIEYFKNVETLNLNFNQMTEFTAPSLPNLIELNCYYNKLKTLNVNKLVNLKWLACYENQLTELHVDMLLNLTHLYCGSNKLTDLEIAPLTNLIVLECQENQLTTIHIQTNVKLENISCHDNFMSSLDIRHLSRINFIRAGLQNDGSGNKQLLGLTLTQQQKDILDPVLSGNRYNEGVSTAVAL